MPIKVLASYPGAVGRAFISFRRSAKHCEIFGSPRSISSTLATIAGVGSY
jgi:hypothetical protein